MLCVHGFTIDSYEFFSLANVKYLFRNQEERHVEFKLKEYQVKKSDIIRFEAFDNEGDIFLLIIGNQHGMGNIENNKDILVLVVDLDEMIDCQEVMQ